MTQIPTEIAPESVHAVFAGAMVIGVTSLVCGVVFGVTGLALFAAGFGVVAALAGAVVGAVRGPRETSSESGQRTESTLGTGEEGQSIVQDNPKGTETDPLETLRQRYARGELSDDVFEQKLAALLETEVPEDARRRAQRADETPADRELESSQS